MTQPVSVVVPALDDTKQFEKHLPDLLSEFDRRKLGDEVIVVDDTGDDVLRRWFEQEFPRVKGVVHGQNRGPGRALLSGARAAKHELLFCLRPSVLVRRGCLDPLTEAMQDAQVFAVSPRVLHTGEQEQVRSLRRLHLDGGLPAVVEEDPSKWSGDEHAITALGGPAFMLRREALLELRPDRLFAPNHLESVDLGLQALCAGQRLLEIPAAEVEHHPTGPRESCPADLVDLAQAKNLLLSFWKHVQDPDLAAQHMARLWDAVLAAAVEESMADIEPLVLALEQLPDLAAAREEVGEPTHDLQEVLRSPATSLD